MVVGVFVFIIIANLLPVFCDKITGNTHSFRLRLFLGSSTDAAQKKIVRLAGNGNVQIRHGHRVDAESLIGNTRGELQLQNQYFPATRRSPSAKKVPLLLTRFQRNSRIL